MHFLRFYLILSLVLRHSIESIAMDPGQDRQPATNGYTRGPSTRVKPIVNYEEKRPLADVRADIKHGAGPKTTLNELEERINDLGESWETESLFEDALEDLTEDRFSPDGQFIANDPCPSVLDLFSPRSRPLLCLRAILTSLCLVTLCVWTDPWFDNPHPQPICHSIFFLFFQNLIYFVFSTRDNNELTLFL